MRSFRRPSPSLAKPKVCERELDRTAGGPGGRTVDVRGDHWRVAPSGVTGGVPGGKLTALTTLDESGNDAAALLSIVRHLEERARSDRAGGGGR